MKPSYQPKAVFISWVPTDGVLKPRGAVIWHKLYSMLLGPRSQDPQPHSILPCHSGPCAPALRTSHLCPHPLPRHSVLCSRCPGSDPPSEGPVASLLWRWEGDRGREGSHPAALWKGAFPTVGTAGGRSGFGRAMAELEGPFLSLGHREKDKSGSAGLERCRECWRRGSAR